MLLKENLLAPVRPWLTTLPREAVVSSLSGLQGRGGQIAAPAQLSRR